MGTTVELTPAQADWVNRDSPGTLALVKPGVKLVTGQPVPLSKLLGQPDPEPEPEPKEAEPAAAAEGPGEPRGGAPAVSTKDAGAPVATGPRGRGGRSARGRS
jgi:hypothetical protein